MASVLLLGASSAIFAETGPDDSVAGLLRRELRELFESEAWEVDAVPLYLSASMAARAVATVEHRRPDVVVLFLSGFNLVFDDAVNQIRALQPSLGSFAFKLTALLKRVAGGGPRGTGGPRGWLFRGPRMLARRLFGVAPLVSVDAAIAYATETIDVLAAGEGVRLICRMPTFHWSPERIASDAEGRVVEFGRAIAERCRARGVETFDLAELMAREGKRPGLGPDATHVDEATRQFEASHLARLLAAAPEPGQPRAP